MDKTGESAWRIALLGSRRLTNEHYQRLSFILLFVVVAGFLTLRAFTFSLQRLLEQAELYGFRRFLYFVQLNNGLLSARAAYLSLLGEFIIWYLAHRLWPKRFFLTARIAVLFLLISTTVFFFAGLLSPSLITAFNLILILLHPILSWAVIATVTVFLLLARIGQQLLLGIPLLLNNTIDYLAVLLLLSYTYHEIYRLNRRYQKKLKELGENLEQSRSIRSLMGNGLLVLDAKLNIYSDANHQAYYLLGVPLTKGSNFPDIIAKLTEQGVSIKEQIKTFFSLLGQKNFSGSQRIHINPMTKLRIFYPGGCKYLSIDAQPLGNKRNSSFIVSIVDVSSQVELDKRRAQWLSEEFQNAEFLRSLLLDNKTLATVASSLRAHYLVLDKAVFNERHKEEPEKQSSQEFVQLVQQELEWFQRLMAELNFPLFCTKISQCRQQLSLYLEHGSYHQLLNTFTTIQLLTIEFRRLRKIMLEILQLQDGDDSHLPLTAAEKKRLIVLLDHLWDGIDEKN